MGRGERPEHVAPPEVYYNEAEARKYTTNSRMIEIQVREPAYKLPQDGCLVSKPAGMQCERCTARPPDCQIQDGGIEIEASRQGDPSSLKGAVLPRCMLWHVCISTCTTTRAVRQQSCHAVHSHALLTVQLHRETLLPCQVLASCDCRGALAEQPMPADSLVCPS
jgi:hypothetical protein